MWKCEWRRAAAAPDPSVGFMMGAIYLFNCLFLDRSQVFGQVFIGVMQSFDHPFPGIGKVMCV